MKIDPKRALVWALIAAAVSCGPKPKEAAKPPAPAEPSGLVRVGSVVITEADLDYQLKKIPAAKIDAEARNKALDELTQRARMVQAALDADLDQDPEVRAEIARVLTNRYKQQAHQSPASAVPEIPEARLRELYDAGESRFRANEKREVAVLWLNPKGDPERTQQYQAKLAEARDWFFKNDVKDHPEQGFSVLGVDHSEHQASRYKGGVVGWLENSAQLDPWSKAVADIAFSLKDLGEVSPVVTRPEGVFLVRYMAQKASVLRPLKEVSGELARAEQQRLRELAEAEFEAALKAKYPVESLTPRKP
jgi:hypothetical protein